MSRDAVAAMGKAGFAPALVVETSPGNYQAWVKHGERLIKEQRTAAARALAERFGGDPGAADWRHFGRLAGFTNRKEKYRDPVTGLHPFVKILEATGAVYPEAERFIGDVRKQLEADQKLERERRARARSVEKESTPAGDLKSIEIFRADPRYGGDGTRVDLALCHIRAIARNNRRAGGSSASVPRPSHKGGERRQADYVERTIKKALESARSHALGR